MPRELHPSGCVFQGEALGSQKEVRLARAVARLVGGRLFAAGERVGGLVAGTRDAGGFLLCG